MVWPARYAHSREFPWSTMADGIEEGWARQDGDLRRGSHSGALSLSFSLRELPFLPFLLLPSTVLANDVDVTSVHGKDIAVKIATKSCDDRVEIMTNGPYRVP